MNYSYDGPLVLRLRIAHVLLSLQPGNETTSLFFLFFNNICVQHCTAGCTVASEAKISAPKNNSSKVQNSREQKEDKHDIVK